MARSRSVRALAVAAVLLAVAPVAACSSDADTLAQDWANGGEKGYITGDGSTTSFPESARTDPVVFSGTDERGERYGSDDTIGSVTVVNFWYAGCAPCRAEAPVLVAAEQEFADRDVVFVGVNTRDQIAQAQQFAEEFGVVYPSIMDSAGDRAVQRAFAGQVPLNAVPTTLVLDREGRVAHRVVGQLAAESQLRTLIAETLAEG